MATKLRQGGLADVRFTTLDGNLKRSANLANETIGVLIFDTSTYPDLFTKGYGKENADNLELGDVIHISYLDEAVDEYGIIPRVEPEEGEDENDVNFMHGIPYYHIREYFRRAGGEFVEASLYVMFADCSKDWDAVDIAQNATGGVAHQIGIYTEQMMFGSDLQDDGTYNLKLVRALEDKARQLEDEHKPAVIVLHANTGSVEGGEDAGVIDIKKLPTLVVDCRHVAVLIGQANTKLVHNMQKASKTHAPIGFVGAFMGLLSRAKVSESVAWVQKFNMFDDEFLRSELGVGDINLDEDGELKSTNMMEGLSTPILNNLAKKGYNFPVKYTGNPNGIYASDDATCDDGDFYNIVNNRTIHKVRRGVRLVLLPKLHSPVLVNRADGTLTPTKITEIRTDIKDVLEDMITAEEISGYDIYIDPKQQVLLNDTLEIQLSIVPVGKFRNIEVMERISISTSKK